MKKEMTIEERAIRLIRGELMRTLTELQVTIGNINLKKIGEEEGLATLSDFEKDLREALNLIKRQKG
jgi:hypothetical protein